MHTLMLILMNWGYFIAALWALAGIAIYEFVPPFPFKRDLVVAAGMMVLGHVFTAYIFHAGIAYQSAIYEKIARQEYERQQQELAAAQEQGAKAVLELKMKEAATEKLQKDYDELSHKYDSKQCLTPEQLRRIDDSGKGSGNHHSALDASDPHSADAALPSVRLPAAATHHRHRRRKR